MGEGDRVVQQREEEESVQFWTGCRKRQCNSVQDGRGSSAMLVRGEEETV
jgi:hypothetical protein